MFWNSFFPETSSFLCHCVWILLAHTHQKYQPLIPVIARPIYDTLGGRYIKCRRLWKTSESITLARWINNHIFWVLHLGMEYAFLNIVFGTLLPKCVGLWHTSNVYFFHYAFLCQHIVTEMASAINLIFIHLFAGKKVFWRCTDY